MAQSNPENEKKIIEEIDLTQINDKMKASTAGFLEDFHVDSVDLLRNIQFPVLVPNFPQDVPGSDPEPVYGAAIQRDIQGNILPGFNKGLQNYLFYRIAKTQAAKQFLAWLGPYLASMDEVLAFRRMYRAQRYRLGRKKNFLCSTWVNIAFSHAGIGKLEGLAVADSFGDQGFKQGLSSRSTYLGDPDNAGQPGHRESWKVGGPENEADLVIIVGSDSSDMHENMLEEIRKKALLHDLELIFEQAGKTLPGDLHGHEHFGFKDGISQPGVRGKLSAAPGDYITPRYYANTDERRLYYGKPGQLMAWPGQFLLGEPRQDPNHLYHAGTVANNFPNWANRGSYLVVRRLQQDVSSFWSFVKAGAIQAGVDPTKFASMLVGRWPSGAPISRSPLGDNPALGDDDFANNHFLFDDDTRPANLRPIPGYGGDAFPKAMADFLATVCPHFAHIRKVNPRDSATDLGKAQDNLIRMILRRGIPYGPPLIGVKNPDQDLAERDRGLMFLCYCNSIEDQFEFMQRRWGNSDVQPNFGGHDPVIGQHGGSRGRERYIDFPSAGGVVRIKFKEEWVIPTGGGYFFAPTISAVRNVLAQ